MAVTPHVTLLPAPVYFLSDAHLGAVHLPDPAEQAVMMDRFLGRVADDGRSLVFVGDLFDFWYEWRHVVPKRHFALLHRIRTLVERGVAVHLLAGNHDFRLHGFLEHSIGMTVHDDGLIAEIAGAPTYILHGDGILARDHGYRFLKKLLRNRAAQRLFALLHPDLAIALASGTSTTSHVYTKVRPEDDREYLEFARRKFAEGYRNVVLGHLHRPYEYVDNDHTYVNLGDWITKFTYARHDGERLSLQQMSSS
ncbi:MAG: UDP-2,3-diacylglucosamine diphosphatase [bacterium]|nr:UDP-2,3-diacylglucosamine diphosphatase [bacterium]